MINPYMGKRKLIICFVSYKVIKSNEINITKIIINLLYSTDYYYQGI